MSITLTNSVANCNQKENNFLSIDFESIGDAPITLAEAKRHLVVTFDDDDSYITELITQCIRSVEKETGTCIQPQTVFVLADIIKEFQLPCGPITSFTSAEIKTGINVYAALTQDTGFEIDSDLQFARFIPYQFGRMKLTYDAGYGADIPEDLKLAVLNEIAFRYENRGDQKNIYANQHVGLSEGARTLAAPFVQLCK